MMETLCKEIKLISKI